MYEFNVVKDGNKLRITSNTCWNCSVYGSLIIDKESGVGNEEITMSLPKEIPFGNGSVIFTYGDDRCDYPAIDVYLSNDCHIETDPMFIREKVGENSFINVLKLSYNGDNDAVNIKVYSNSEWSVPNSATTFINENDLIIIPQPGVCSSTTYISTCGGGNIVYVELYNKNGGKYSENPFETYNVTTGLSAEAKSSKTFGCDGGEYKAEFYENYDVYGKYAFIDCCGIQHDDDIKEEKISSSNRILVETKSGEFGTWNCCDGPHYEDATLSHSIGKYSASIDFKQECNGCGGAGCHTCYIEGSTSLECEGTSDYSLIVDSSEVTGNLGWSISPKKDLVEIDSGGTLTFKRHTRDTTYTISCSNSDCGSVYKSISIKACKPYSISLKVSADTSYRFSTAKDIVLETTNGNLTFNGINISTDGNDVKTVEINSSFDGATIQKANVTCNDRNTYKASYSPSIISDGQTYLLVIKKKCVTPIQVKIYGGMLGGGFAYFLLTDGDITDANKEAVKNNAQVKLYGTYYSPISLGYFHYDDDCNGVRYDNESNTVFYCHLTTNGCSAVKMDAEHGATYTLYEYLSGRDMFIKAINLWFPTYEKCQENQHYGVYNITTPEQS